MTVESPPALDRGQRALAVGLVLAITLNAFEALGTAAAMQRIAEELDGDSLYGASFTAFMLAQLVTIVVVGGVADRKGPGPPFALALVAFTAGLVLAGIAPEMEVLVLARVLQGLGGGGLAACAYVGVGRAFSSEQRPRMFALLSTAWVLPGLLAPPVAGLLTEHLTWRLVFLGLLPLVPVLAALSLPALRRLTPEAGAATSDAEQRERVRLALALAAGTGLALAGLGQRHPVVAVGLLVAGVALAAGPLRRLLPQGTLVARRGLPAAIASRGLLNFAFFGTEITIPFALARIHGASDLLAGVAISASSVVWTAGSIWQARHGARFRPGRVVGVGFACVATGVAVLLPVAWERTPVLLAFVGWAIAGGGMGLAYNTTSVVALDVAPAGREGVVSSSIQMADSLGFALASGVAGAVIAAGDRADRSETLVVLTIWLLMLAVAAVGSGAARRVSRHMI